MCAYARYVENGSLLRRSSSSACGMAPTRPGTHCSPRKTRLRATSSGARGRRTRSTSRPGRRRSQQNVTSQTPTTHGKMNHAGRGLPALIPQKPRYPTRKRRPAAQAAPPRLERHPSTAHRCVAGAGFCQARGPADTPARGRRGSACSSPLHGPAPYATPRPRMDSRPCTRVMRPASTRTQGGRRRHAATSSAARAPRVYTARTTLTSLTTGLAVTEYKGSCISRRGPQS